MTEKAAKPATSTARGRSKEVLQTRWHKQATRALKVAMAGADVSFKELAARLEADDASWSESAETIAKRVRRGTFTFEFALRVLHVLGSPMPDLPRIQGESQARKRK